MPELRTLIELFKENSEGKFQHKKSSKNFYFYYDSKEDAFRTKHGASYHPANPLKRVWRFYEVPKGMKHTTIDDATPQIEALEKENARLKQKLKGALIKKKWPEERPKYDSFYAIQASDICHGKCEAFFMDMEWFIRDIPVTDQEFYFYEPYEEGE